MANEKTDGRRERVRALWMKSDVAIAEILIEEGYGPKASRTAAGRAKQLETMRRNVWNDRAWWRAAWRAAERSTREDVNETRGEYLARLDSYITEGITILEDPKMKGTPRVQALSELRQLEQAKAKARGVEALPAEESDPDVEDDGSKFLGLVLTTGKLTPAALKRIHGWEKEGAKKKRRKGGSGK